VVSYQRHNNEFSRQASVEQGKEVERECAIEVSEMSGDDEEDGGGRGRRSTNNRGSRAHRTRVETVEKVQTLDPKTFEILQSTSGYMVQPPTL
jgi:hypothetical protein